MAKFGDIVEVTDRQWNRAVRVTIEAPSLAGVDIQSLAQKAGDRRARKRSKATSP